MNIVFMGTPDYATIIFEEILKYYDVVALFTQPDKKIGRKQILTPPHIKQYCIDNEIKIPIYQPSTLKDNDIKDTIEGLKPDFIIVAAYGQILPKNILDIAPCINLHASLLPKYRGASPIQEAILNDDKYTGITAMMMEEGLDSGNILGYSYIEVGNSDIEELFSKLSILAKDLTIDILKRFDDIMPKKQNIADVSYCKKISKSNSLIRLDDAKEVYQKYKAYRYWPEIYLENKLKLKEIDINDLQHTNNENEILDIKKDYIVVGCKKGSIKIYSIQAPSKKMIKATEYIKGKRLKVGDSII